MGTIHKIHNVSLPANVNKEEEYLFAPFLSYEIFPSKIKKLQNVFVTYSGLCANSNGLIKECHHNYPKQFEEYFREVAYYYRDTKNHPENLINLEDGQTYLLIHHPWFNYYHWICEAIFRLWIVKEKIDQMILLLPDYYEKSDFIMGSLEPFKLKKILFIPQGKSLQVKNIYMPQIKPIVDSYNNEMLIEVRNFYMEFVSKVKKIHLNFGDKIYISRKRAGRKKVWNEDDVENILVKHGFRIINNEDFTFQEQVSIYSQTKYLVSMHGSGLTNMLFMPENSFIMELHKKKTNEKDWHSFAFWYLSSALNHVYYHQLCEPTNLNDDYFNANVIVDTELLDKNLARMFSQ